VTYVGGKETYERLNTSNTNYTKDTVVPKGIRSFGEFGGLMRSVLGHEADAQLEWKAYAELDGQRVHVFEFKVTHENSMYKLTQESPFRTHKPAYSGQILAEIGTMHVRRINLRTAGISEKFPFQEATHEIDYSFQRLGGDSFLLPSKSLMQTRVGKRTIVRSEMEFSNYRKWASDSKIRFDVADPPQSLTASVLCEPTPRPPAVATPIGRTLLASHRRRALRQRIQAHGVAPFVHVRRIRDRHPNRIASRRSARGPRSSESCLQALRSLSTEPPLKARPRDGVLRDQPGFG